MPAAESAVYRNTSGAVDILKIELQAAQDALATSHTRALSKLNDALDCASGEADLFTVPKAPNGVPKLPLVSTLSGTRASRENGKLVQADPVLPVVPEPKSEPPGLHVPGAIQAFESDAIPERPLLRTRISEESLVSSETPVYESSEPRPWKSQDSAVPSKGAALPKINTGGSLPIDRAVQILDVWTTKANTSAVKALKKMDAKNKHLIRQATKGVTQDDDSDSDDDDGMSPARIESGIIYKQVRPVESKLVIHPHSLQRFFWDIISLVLVLYDMAFLPLGVFDPPGNVLTLIMAWCTRLFWTFDVPASFLTGFLDVDGSVQMRIRKIARRYVSTFLVLDVFLVSIDWSELFWPSYNNEIGMARIGKAARIFRILRMLRLLRLIRMREKLKRFIERTRSEKLIIFMSIICLLVMIVGVAHLVACLWYGVGAQGSNTWVAAFFQESDSIEYRYVTSLHWSLSQFSGGMDEVKPHNLGERVFAVIAFLFAFMASAMTISELTSSLTRLHILSSHQSRQLSSLRRYLLHNGITEQLTLRVLRNAHHVMSEQQRLMPEEKVELLTIISVPLRVEIHFEMYAPVLEVHPLFELCSEVCPQVMRRICHQAAHSLLVSSGDIVFNVGETPKQPSMYIVCHGLLVYIPINGAVKPVRTLEWISEAVLWAAWTHRGVLKATFDCRLCALDAKVFSDIICQFDLPDIDIRAYASAYVSNLNEGLEQGTGLTDLSSHQEGSLAKIATQMVHSSTASFNDTPASPAARFAQTIRQTTIGMRQTIARRGSVLLKSSDRRSRMACPSLPRGLPPGSIPE